MPVVKFTETRFPLTKLPTTKSQQYKEPYDDLFAVFNTLRMMWGYLDESLETIQASISGFISDAPSDGSTYGRKDGAWVVVGGGGVAWGAITGTLSAQTDLQTALNAKEPTITAGTTAQYWRGDKSWQTLPAPGISDAPSDGSRYARLNGAWSSFTPGIGEAPNDGQQYARQSLGWAVVSGGGGGGTVLPNNVVFTATRSSSSSNYANNTVFGKIPGRRMLNAAQKFKFSMWFQAAGSFILGAIKVMTTALESNTVIATTTVTIGGSATPTLTPTTGGVFQKWTTDTITLNLEPDKDYWLVCYISVSSANSPNIGTMAVQSEVLGGYASGNQSGVTTIPVAAGSALLYTEVYVVP